MLKVKSKDKYNVARFGTRLYDLDTDPTQSTPLHDPQAEQAMIALMERAMAENDCPPEQFDRLGLHRPE